MQKIEMLTFVFVQSFDLNIKEGIRVNLQAKPLSDDMSERLFVPIFNRSKILTEVENTKCRPESTV